MTVGAMLKSMSQRELCEWIAFFRIETEEYEQEKKKIEDSKRQAEIEEQKKRDAAMVNQLLKLAYSKD